MDLKSILDSVPEVKQKTGTVDISADLGMEPGSVVLEFQQMDVARVFKVESEAKQLYLALRKRGESITEETARVITMLGICHTAPSGEGVIAPADFYFQLGQKNCGLLLGILEQLPEIFGIFDQARLEAKKNTSESLSAD